MARGRRRKKSDSVLFKSAEWIGWALAGLEREIVETRARLGVLNEQAAKLRGRVGVAAKRGVAAAVAAASPEQAAGPAAPPRAHVRRRSQADFRDDEEALAGSEKEEQDAAVAVAGVGLPGNAPAEPTFGGPLIRKVCRRDVLDRHPERFEQRDLAGRLTPGDRPRR